MKKTRLLNMLSLATLLFLAGCPWDDGGPDTVDLDESNNGDTVSLASGDRLVVTLDSNATTSFSWGLAELDESVLTMADNTYTVNPDCAPDAVGCGGYETWTFDAVAPGTTTLRLEYRRWWDTAADAADAFEITVNVTR